MTYTEWKKTLTSAHWDKIREAMLNDSENDNAWADDNEYLLDVVMFFKGKEEFVWNILEEKN